MFSSAGSQGHANSSAYSVARNIDYMANGRGAITRWLQCSRQMQAAIEDDQNSAEGTGQVKVRKRFYRNKDERYTFLLELLERGERLQRVDDANDRRLTRRASSMLSSHKAQIRRQLPHILAEMHKNERSRRRSFNLSTVQQKTSVYSWLYHMKVVQLTDDGAKL